MGGGLLSLIALVAPEFLSVGLGSLNTCLHVHIVLLSLAQDTWG